MVMVMNAFIIFSVIFLNAGPCVKQATTGMDVRSDILLQYGEQERMIKASSNFNKIVMFNASPNIQDVKISFKCGPTIVTKMYKLNLVFDGNGNKTGTIMNYVLCGLLFLILSFVLIKKYGFPKFLSMLFNFLLRIFKCRNNVDVNNQDVLEFINETFQENTEDMV